MPPVARYDASTPHASAGGYATVDAVVHDPDGPRLRRALPHVLGWPLILAGLVGATHVNALLVLALGGFALVTGGPGIVRRSRGKRAQIRLLPGALQLPDRTLTTRQVTGASAAACSDGTLTLALATDKRARPIQIELANAADLHAVRDALGIGDRGFGTIRFTTARTLDRTLRAWVARVVAIALVIAIALLFASHVLHGTAPGRLLAKVGTLLALLPLYSVPIFALLGLVSQTSPSPTVTLDARGLRYPLRASGYAEVPYGAVTAFLEGPDGVLLRGAEGRPFPVIAIPRTLFERAALSNDEVRLLRAQIRSAVARARGEGPPRSDPTERVGALARRDEDARAWLARVESAAAAAAARGGASYRGGGPAEEDLWDVARDHDADPYVRTAALRILRRVAPEEARVRVPSIVESVHDDAARACLRVALSDDLDEAASELEAADRASARAR